VDGPCELERIADEDGSPIRPPLTG